MITVTINDKDFEAVKGETILSLAKRVGFEIPTLCFLDKISENASCRICVVEDENKKLVTACSTKVYDKMQVKTDSAKVIQSRINTLKLLAEEGVHECDNCSRDGNCSLQKLFDKYEIKHISNKEEKKDESTKFITKDYNKCILCDRCVNTCDKVQSLSIINRNNRGINTHIGCEFEKDLEDSKCIACGQCTLVCPTGSLMEKDNIKEVEKELLDENKIVVVATAPAARVGLGDEFDFELGANVKGKLVSSLKQLGFNKVFDVNFGADLTIIEEVTELLNRFKNKGPLPLFTSCCPSWVKYVENYEKDLMKHVSTCKSPQQMLGTIIKTYYANINNINPDNLVVVMIMPCVSKKDECFDTDVDYVLTTRELGRLIKKNNIDFNNLKDENYDELFGYGASVNFGASGGVTESVLRTFSEVATNKPLENVSFKEVRGIKGVKEASYTLGDTNLNVAIVSGIKSAKEVIEKVKKGEVDYHFIEFMACPGGCINGGGQSIIDLGKYSIDDIKLARINSIYSEDEKQQVRLAHKNKDIANIYNNYLGKPGSEKAHKLLHKNKI